MSLYNLHYLEFLATSHDKFWSHPLARREFSHAWIAKGIAPDLSRFRLRTAVPVKRENAPVRDENAPVQTGIKGAIASPHD